MLQQACGFEYTSKLQRMFQDIGVSKDLNEKFREHLRNSATKETSSIDFSIQVTKIAPFFIDISIALMTSNAMGLKTSIAFQSNHTLN